MSPTSSAPIGVSRFLIWLFIVFNLLAGGLLVAGFVASFALEQQLTPVVAAWLPGANTGLLLPVVRVWLLLALPAVAAIHLLLCRTLDILQTVRLGHPFEGENARRLRTMAWCMLAVQTLNLAGAAMARLATVAIHRSINFDISLVGWLGVVLLFVLAQVFEAGTRLRTELDEMI